MAPVFVGTHNCKFVGAVLPFYFHFQLQLHLHIALSLSSFTNLGGLLKCRA